MTALWLPAKRKMIVEAANMLFDVAKESADWFPPLRSALGGMNAVIVHHQVALGLTAVAHN